MGASSILPYNANSTPQAHTPSVRYTCRTLASQMPPLTIFLTLSALCGWETELGPQDRPGKVRMCCVASPRPHVRPM